MSRQVKIAAGKTLVQLPDGGHYDAGKNVVLTDDQFARIRASLMPGYVIDNGAVEEVGEVLVAIASGKHNVQLPSGDHLDSLQEANLTPAQFAQLQSSLIPGYVVNEDDKLVLIDIPIELADIADGNVNVFTPSFPGSIVAFDFITTVPVTTAAKASTISLLENGVIVNGGVIALTSAAATPAGKRIAGSAVIPSRSEVQTITVDATAGTYKITYAGQQTGAIAFNALASAVQTALEALSNVEPGDVVVTGGVGASGGGTPYTLTWRSGLGNVVAPTTQTTLTGGGSTAVVATSIDGSVNAFNGTSDTVSIVAASTTTFVEGEGILRLSVLKS